MAPGRVSFLLPSLAGGGAERVSLLLAREFARRGLKSDFVLMRAEGALLDEAAETANIICLDVPSYWELPGKLIRHLRSERPTAMIASMWPLTGVAALARIASGIRSRLIVVEHSTLSQGEGRRSATSIFVHRYLGRYIYRGADRVVAVSLGVKDDLQRRTGLSSSRLNLIYNPVRLPSADYADEEILRRWQAEDRIIAVGNLRHAKDFPTLLRAFAEIAAFRDVRLLILGEGKLRAELEELRNALGLEAKVHMPGYVPDPYPYLARADLFVLSSAWEGLPGALIEALVAGVPVVSTDCRSGPAEILCNGKYGRLVPVRDAEALAAAMAEALDSEHDRDRLKARGAEFSVERAADQYLTLLDPDGELLAGRL